MDEFSNFVLPQSVQNSLRDLYIRYKNELKPVFVLLEVEMQEFPGPILNEVRHLTSHLSSCFLAEVEGDEKERYQLKQIEEANTHLSRAIIDCYKGLLIVSEEAIASFWKEYKDVRLHSVSNGKFLPVMNSLHRNAKEITLEAHKLECSDSVDITIDDVYDKYKEAYIAYTKVRDYIDEKDNQNGLSLAKGESRKKIIHSIILTILGAIIGIVLDRCLSCFFLNMWVD